MMDIETKKKVLEEIMSLMDEKEGEKLKSHPKFMAAKIEVAKPVEGDAEMMKEKMLGDESEMKPGHELSESPGVESSEEEISPEMIDMLLKKYKDEV